MKAQLEYDLGKPEEKAEFEAAKVGFKSKKVLEGFATFLVKNTRRIDGANCTWDQETLAVVAKEFERAARMHGHDELLAHLSKLQSGSLS